MASWKNILEDIRDQINTGTYTPTFTATRSYIPKDKMITLDNYSVVVFPRTEDRERLNRSAYKATYGATVAVSIKLAATAKDEGLDAPLVLVSQIMAVLQDFNYSSIKVRTVEIQNNPVYDYQKFGDSSIFQSLINLTLEGEIDA